MARPQKIGLEYYSHDVQAFNDRKLKLLNARFGLLGYGFFFRLCDIIYENGYYVKWNKDDEELFAAETRLSIEQFKELLDYCLYLGLFHRELFEKEQILTSARIQKNYIKGCERRHEVTILKKYCLIDPEEIVNPKSKLLVNISQDELMSNENNINPLSMGLMLNKNNNNYPSEDINVNINPLSEDINVNINPQKEKEKEKEKESKRMKGVNVNINSKNHSQEKFNNEFFKRLFLVWKDEFKLARNFDYKPTNLSQDMDALKNLFLIYLQVNHSRDPDPNPDTEIVINGFRALFRQCMEVDDQWLARNASPAMIFRKFNEYKSYFANGKKFNNYENEIDPEYKRSFLERYYPDSATQ